MVESSTRGAGDDRTHGRRSLLGCTRGELEVLVAELGVPRFRAEQLYEGLYQRRLDSFAGLTSLPKGLRASLEDAFDLGRPRLDRLQVSCDGTRKYRFAASDGQAFEAVYIPEVAPGSRTNTLCISSQSGCALGCKFCFTASLRHHRDLTASEILGQVLAVDADVIGALGDEARLSNVVFMGMGEPLLNFDNVTRAAALLIDPAGLNFSNRRVTISTSGIVPRICELGRKLSTQLAVSLNATTDEVRTRIMPINKKWPLAALLEALHAYPLPPRRRITIEYVLLRDVNDSVADARRLPKLLAGIPVKVNLLPLNPHDRTEFAPPAPEQVERFQAELKRAGINTLKRTPRGQDIAAACGRLGESSAPA
jgi:23S rRNA (adenine2503-C2)-methyltransferase